MAAELGEPETLPQEEPFLLDLDTSNTAPLEVQPRDPLAGSTLNNERSFPDISFPLNDPAASMPGSMSQAPQVPQAPQELQTMPSMKRDKELLE